MSDMAGPDGIREITADEAVAYWRQQAQLQAKRAGKAEAETATLRAEVERLTATQWPCVEIRKRADDVCAENERLRAESEGWKTAFAAQSRKLQSVLHIPGVKEALAQEKPKRDNLQEVRDETR